MKKGPTHVPSNCRSATVSVTYEIVYKMDVGKEMVTAVRENDSRGSGSVPRRLFPDPPPHLCLRFLAEDVNQ